MVPTKSYAVGILTAGLLKDGSDTAENGLSCREGVDTAASLKIIRMEWNRLKFITIVKDYLYKLDQ